MNHVSQYTRQGNRRHVLLSPRAACASDLAGGDAYAYNEHHRILCELQRLRGRILVSEGAMPSSDLTRDGRDASYIDDLAWHLVTLDETGAVGGCVRMLVHSPQAEFDSLLVSRTAIAKCPDRGVALRSAVELELTEARATGTAVVEIGGWMLTEAMRCSAEAVRLALGVWAWGRLMGGAVGFATATVRNCSESILRRIGGSPLRHDGEPILQYFEPKYGCDIQILRFDSASLRDRYSPVVEAMRKELSLMPVLSANSSSALALHGLYHAVHEPRREAMARISGSSPTGAILVAN